MNYAQGGEGVAMLINLTQQLFIQATTLDELAETGPAIERSQLAEQLESRHGKTKSIRRRLVCPKCQLNLLF
jgi:hypothetical protein